MVSFASSLFPIAVSGDGPKRSPADGRETGKSDVEGRDEL
jgi:hypothetical protein